MNKKLLIIILVVAILTVGLGWFGWSKYYISKIDSFEKCQAAGYPVQESYPARCTVPNGKSFTEEIISPNKPDGGIACTMDAKACPDGSFVGRVAPACEFSPCPE